MASATLQLTSTKITDVYVDDAGDFLESTALPVDIDHQITMQVNLNEVFKYTALPWNKTDEETTGVHNKQDTEVMPIGYAKFVMYYQAKEYLKREWADLENSSGTEHGAQVLGALKDLFDTGKPNSGYTEIGTPDDLGNILNMRQDPVDTWVNNAEGTWDQSDQKYITLHATAPFSAYEPSELYGGGVFNYEQLQQLLEGCSDAGRFKMADIPDFRDYSTLRSSRVLDLRDGDQLAVKVRVTQRTKDGNDLDDTGNTATWLVVLEQSAGVSSPVTPPADLSGDTVHIHNYPNPLQDHPIGEGSNMDRYVLGPNAS